MTGDVGFLTAIGAGVVSFLSPCVLPLIPGYLSFLGGLSLGTPGSSRSRASEVIVPAALFVLGFSTVFVLLGVAASLLGGAVSLDRVLISRIAGSVILVFGFFMLGLVKVPWLYGEARFDPAKARSLGVWAAPVMGASFGFAWTPCVGPVLGSILMLAARSGNAGQGAMLLAAYSAGLGIPFLLSAALLERITPVTRWLSRHSTAVSRVSGVVLMLLGLAVLTGKLGLVTAFISRWVPLATG